MSSVAAFSGKTLDDLSAWLNSVGIPTDSYGVGASKPLDLLLNEVEEGESVLTVDDKGSPLRLVGVMNVIIKNNKQQTLYEARQVLPTGSTRTRNLPLAEKLLPNERWQDAAVRAVREELGPILGDAPRIDIKHETYKESIEYKESQSYPGLLSRYTCHRVEASVEGLPEEDFNTTEERSDGTLIHCWEWK